ncbi:hypothetical protein AOLI_G00174240 [Acnodon oligacanthus]
MEQIGANCQLHFLTSPNFICVLIKRTLSILFLPLRKKHSRLVRKESTHTEEHKGDVVVAQQQQRGPATA